MRETYQNIVGEMLGAVLAQAHISAKKA